MNTGALLNVIRMFFLLIASFIGVSVALGEAPENWWFAGWFGAIEEANVHDDSHDILGRSLGYLTEEGGQRQQQEMPATGSPSGVRRLHGGMKVI